MKRGERQVLDSRINLAPAYLHNFVWQCIDVWSIKWLCWIVKITILANNVFTTQFSNEGMFYEIPLAFCVKITSGLSCVCSFRKTQSFMLLFQIIIKNIFSKQRRTLSGRSKEKRTIYTSLTLAGPGAISPWVKTTRRAGKCGDQRT